MNPLPQRRTLQQDQTFLAERAQKKKLKTHNIVISPVKKQLKAPKIKKNVESADDVEGTPYTEDVVSQLAELSIHNSAEYPEKHYATSSSHFAATVESVLPVEHLKLWRANQPVNMLTYLPTKCPSHKVLMKHITFNSNFIQGKDVCHIVLYGKDTRERCFDTESPFILAFQKYQCSTHSYIIFSLLQSDLKDYSITPQVVSFERTIVTTKFLDYIFMTIPSHSFNFSALAKTIVGTWISNLSHKIRMVRNSTRTRCSVGCTLYTNNI